MSKAWIHEPRLPTEDEEVEVLRSFGEALSHLQHRVFGIKALVASDEGKPVTFEDIGRLYSFIENVKLDRWALDQELKDLDELLQQLYIARDEVVQARERGDA